MNKIDFVDSNYIIRNMAKSGEKVYLISCVNFEQRSIAFTNDIISAYIEEGFENNLAISSWRLKSNRPNPWSLMEEKKKELINKIKKLSKGIKFEFEEILWSDSQNTAELNFIDNKVCNYEKQGYNLIVDLSAMPHNICYEFSKKLARYDISKYKSIYIIYTSAKEYLARDRLGPSQVGNINIERVNTTSSPTKLAMVFPGREGHEAALAISMLKGYEITVAVNFFDPDILNALDICYANQLVCSETIKGAKDNICYYYSQQDLQRVLEEFRKQAEELKATYVEFAIFDINWRIISVAFEAAKFEEKDINVHLSKFGDSSNSNTYQYHNLYSKGVGQTNMFLISEGKTEEMIEKEIEEKEEKIWKYFEYCNAVVIDVCDTIWHDSKYYSEYKESVFKIIKREKNSAEKTFTNAILNERLESFRDGSTGEPAYAKAIESLCRNLRISKDGMKEVEVLSVEFKGNQAKLFKTAKKTLLEIMKNKKCIVVTRAAQEDFERKKKASKINIQFDDVKFIKNKSESSWEEIHVSLKAQGLIPLYIGNSYKEDIEPNINLEHSVIWFNHEENYFGRKGMSNETLPANLIQVQSWNEIFKALTVEAKRHAAIVKSQPINTSEQHIYLEEKSFQSNKLQVSTISKQNIDSRKNSDDYREDRLTGEQITYNYNYNITNNINFHGDNANTIVQQGTIDSKQINQFKDLESIVTEIRKEIKNYRLSCKKQKELLNMVADAEKTEQERSNAKREQSDKQEQSKLKNILLKIGKVLKDFAVGLAASLLANTIV